MDLFRKELFWDVKLESIDIEKNARYIIERVLSRGKLTDWDQLKKLYTQQEITEHMVNIRSMDIRLLTFCSRVFNIPKENFRCYRNNAFYQAP